MNNCPFVCLSVCLYVHLSINPSVCQCYIFKHGKTLELFSSMVELPGYRLELFSWKVIKKVRLFVSMNSCPFVCLSVCPSVCLVSACNQVVLPWN